MKKNIYVVIFTFLASLILLTSCITSYDIKGSLSALRGLQISVPVHKWGYPDREKRSLIEDKKIFIWSSDRRSKSYNRTRTVLNNYDDSSYSNKWEHIAKTSEIISQGLNNTLDRENYCVIRIITDNNNIIESIEYNGRDCVEYAKKLNY